MASENSTVEEEKSESEMQRQQQLTQEDTDDPTNKDPSHPPPTVDEATMKARAAAARAYALSGESSKKKDSKMAAAAAARPPPPHAYPYHHSYAHAYPPPTTVTATTQGAEGAAAAATRGPYPPHYYPYSSYPPHPPLPHGSTKHPEYSTKHPPPPDYAHHHPQHHPPAPYPYYDYPPHHPPPPPPPPSTAAGSTAGSPDAAARGRHPPPPYDPHYARYYSHHPDHHAAPYDYHRYPPPPTTTTTTTAAPATAQAKAATTADTTTDKAKGKAILASTPPRPPAYGYRFSSPSASRYPTATATAAVGMVAAHHSVNSPTKGTTLTTSNIASPSKAARTDATTAATATASTTADASARFGAGGSRQGSSRNSNTMFSPRAGQLPSAAARLAAYSTFNAQTKTLPPGCDTTDPQNMEQPSNNSNNNSNITPLVIHYFDEDDEDYRNFVKGLGLVEPTDDNQSFQLKPEDDDDEEDFLLTNFDDDDDDEEEEDDDDADEESGDSAKAGDKSGDDKEKGGGKTKGDKSTSRGSPAQRTEATPPSHTKRSSLDMDEFDPAFLDELEDELGGLEEEDLEAAVASLLGTTSTSYAQAQKHDAAAEDADSDQAHGSNKNNKPRGENMSSVFAAEAKMSVAADRDRDMHHRPAEPTTPLRTVTGMRAQAVVTTQQVERLQKLLNGHYQALIQQAVLSIQAAYMNRTQRIKDKGEFLSTETYDDIGQILDTSVGMVQDLDQNRKAAIRNAILLENAGSPRKLSRVLDLEDEVEEKPEGETGEGEKPGAEDGGLLPEQQRRLTRAAFSRTLQQHPMDRKSVFNVKGLHRLQETFHALDLCHNPEIQWDTRDEEGEEPTYTKVCRRILQKAGAEFEEDLIPGIRDLSDFFSTPQEFLGDDFERPCDEEQSRFLRRFRNIFASGEDNLVLRGVNLYGEKQWLLIADRYLPDRSVNIISQRYSKLTVMLYKAHGINIDEFGDLDKPPKLESVDDIDDEKVSHIKIAGPPAILNVHRWSLEEDLTLLRAVPLMGHMWAELGARLIPHRDRGHLRKRYQVLERRVKATVLRTAKMSDSSVAKLAIQMKQRRKVPQKPAPIPRQTTGPRLPLPRPQQKRQRLGITIKKAAAPIPGVFSRSRSENMQPFHAPERSSKASAKVTQPAGLDNTESSRAAFENLVKDDHPEWSQMSSMKELMENDVESEIVGALANRLSKSKSKPATEQQPTVTKPTKQVPQQRASIMSKVMERANQPRSPNKSNKEGLKRKSILPSTRVSKRLAASAEKTKYPANDVRTPSALPGSPNVASIFAAADASNVGGVDFESLESRSAVEKKPANKDARKRAALPGSPNAASIFAAADASNVGGVNFESLESRGANFDSLESRGVNFDSLESRGVTFESMESRHVREAMEANSGSSYLSPSNISLLNDPIMEAEAVSALNSLSNSPSRSLFKRPPTATGAPAAAATANEKKKGKEEGQSLFAKAVGGVRERDKKRKRRLNFQSS